jgi:hypothetical protein
MFVRSGYRLEPVIVFRFLIKPGERRDNIRTDKLTMERMRDRQPMTAHELHRRVTPGLGPIWFRDFAGDLLNPPV